MQADVEIINQLGLHARAAARFVEAASRFVAEVTVTNGDESVSVAFEEVESQDWKEQVYTPDIVGGADRLYKKPGYTM